MLREVACCAVARVGGTVAAPGLCPRMVHSMAPVCTYYPVLVRIRLQSSLVVGLDSSHALERTLPVSRVYRTPVSIPQTYS